jgi:hypothetical protein
MVGMAVATIVPSIAIMNIIAITEAMTQVRLAVSTSPLMRGPRRRKA